MMITATIIYLCGPCCMENGEVIEWSPSVQSSLRPPLNAARMGVQELKGKHHRYKDKSHWLIGSQGRSGVFWNSRNTKEKFVFFFKSTIFSSFPSTIHILNILWGPEKVYLWSLKLYWALPCLKLSMLPSLQYKAMSRWWVAADILKIMSVSPTRLKTQWQQRPYLLYLRVLHTPNTVIQQQRDVNVQWRYRKKLFS